MNRTDEKKTGPPVKGANEVEKARKSLKGSILKRRASLSEAEQVFLHALLVDPAPVAAEETAEDADTSQHAERLMKAARVLDDDMLFSVPPPTNGNKKESPLERGTSAGKRAKRPSILGLWKAHEDGVPPKQLAKRGSLSFAVSLKACSGSEDVESGDYESVKSDEEVRPERRPSALRGSESGSSWGEENHQEHFNAWEVLKDEYAEDFGFDYSDRGISAGDVLDHLDTLSNTFRILGTSAEDKSSQPHVLSPPLMDALMSFIPDNLIGQNYWMKFSLTRDGASLATMKTYVRASKYTVLAIETPKGEVFGSFTSHPWRNNFGYFGNAPAFVWKMRRSRQTHCASLFDQAQLESEIDVYFSLGTKDLVQVCRHDMLAIGGDEGLRHDGEGVDVSYLAGSHSSDEMEKNAERGFAIALEDDLMMGTTSPCLTFRSPALCGEGGKKGEIFEVANLEVWTFTPAFDVNSAERLEMTQFFIEESIHSSRHARGSDHSLTPPTSAQTSPFTSTDLVQRQFYRRVGEDTEGDERRDRWQYTNMMHGVDGASRGLGASPRFT